MDTAQTLGQVIRSRRIALGLTQEELAERIGDGVRQAEVSRLERGRVTLPRRQRLAHIADALNMPVGELLASSGWAGAGEALRSPGDVLPESRRTSPPTLEPVSGTAALRDAIAQSRALQEQTTRLLETSMALAARWSAGDTRRNRATGT
jgi:transcriptional regulator with XRE-family HTH domain